MINPKRLVFFLTFFWITAACTLFPRQSSGQDREVTINVSANIISTIELTTLQSIQLSEEEAQSDVIRIDPISSPNSGKMVAFGTPNSEIQISYIESQELTRVNGTETLTFNYRVAGNQLEDQSTAELIDIESRNFSFNDDGEFYFWIGGNVNISTAVPGNYQGEFTLEIDYI